MKQETQRYKTAGLPTSFQLSTPPALVAACKLFQCQRSYHSSRKGDGAEPYFMIAEILSNIQPFFHEDFADSLNSSNSKDLRKDARTENIFSGTHLNADQEVVGW